jgi:hypothetical protein
MLRNVNEIPGFSHNSMKPGSDLVNARNTQ